MLKIPLLTTLFIASAASAIVAQTNLNHGQVATVTGGSFGTRPDYNIGNYTWQGIRHIHFRFGDFAAGLPPVGSSQELFLSQTQGFFPSGTANVGFTFNPDYESINLSMQNGGPSKSGKFFRKIGNAQGLAGYMEAQTDSNPAYPTSPNAYCCFKHRGSGDGKIMRWWRSGIQENWYMGTGAMYRENEWPHGPAGFYSNFTRDGITWRRHEVNLDAVNGSRFWVNGTLMTYNNGVPSAIFLVNSGDSSRNLELAWPNSTDPGAVMDIADIYYDFTAARVEVTAGGKSEIQLCKSWSSSQIEIIFNQGELPAGAGTLKVFNAANSVIYTQAVTIGGGAAAPEVRVLGNGTEVSDGDPSPSMADHTDFGSVDAASGSIIRTYTIQNLGSAPLTASGLSSSTSDFVVTQFPAGSVAAGFSTTFSVKFDPTTSGLRTATLTFNNNDSNENPYNFEIQGTGTNANPSGLPSPWQKVDIGSSTASVATFSGDTFTINGVGSGIGSVSDRFTYVYRPASGDCEITARTLNSGTYGLMIRTDLTAGSAFKSIYINPTGGAFTTSRTGAGLAATAVAAGGGLSRPHYLRLKRVGNTFTVFRSLDGVTWTQAAGAQTFAMSSDVYIGLAQPQSTGSMFDQVAAMP